MSWNLWWKGLAAGDRNGGPVRLATLLHQSTQSGFDEQRSFQHYAQWVQAEGFDSGPTLRQVVDLTRLGLPLTAAVRATHRSHNGSAGIGPAHRSIALLRLATGADLIELAIREAQLSHFDPIAGSCSAASLIICQMLGENVRLNEIKATVEQLFPDLNLTPEQLSAGGFAPAVLAAAWKFLSNANHFDDALGPALQFAGPANYCPVLVGLWAACRFGNVPESWLDHKMCPSAPDSVEL